MIKLIYIYVPEIDFVKKKVVSKGYLTTSKEGKAVIKSGFYFTNKNDSDNYAKVSFEIAQMFRDQKSKYSHVAVEFLYEDLSNPKIKTIKNLKK